MNKYNTSQTQSTLEDHNSIKELSNELQRMQDYITPSFGEILTSSTDVANNLLTSGLDRSSMLEALNNSYYGLFVHPSKNITLGFEKNTTTEGIPWPQDYKVGMRYNF